MNTLNFNSVYSEFYSRVLNYLNVKTNNIELAEDLTQDSFLKISLHLKEFDPSKSKLVTWVFTIVNRTFIDHLKTDKSHNNVLVDGYVNEDGDSSFEYLSNHNERGVEEIEIAEAIESAISNLNEKEQKIATLRFLQDISNVDIAVMLELPIGSVKVTVMRIKEKLQGQLEEQYNML